MIYNIQNMPFPPQEKSFRFEKAASYFIVHSTAVNACVNRMWQLGLKEQVNYILKIFSRKKRLTLKK